MDFQQIDIKIPAKQKELINKHLKSKLNMIMAKADCTLQEAVNYYSALANEIKTTDIKCLH